VLRVVLDTNIFVSSLLVKSGVPAQVLDAWRSHRYMLVLSPPLIAEIRSTLSYPRIRRKYGITDDDVERLIELLLNDAVVVPGIVDVSGAIPDDPKDEMILACAVEGRADLIVSGDKHLLDLGNYRGISMITARDFKQLMDRDPDL
jgi:uncharacterized protein